MGVEVSVAGGASIEVASKADLDAHTERLARILERPHARYYRAFGGTPPRAGNLPFVIRLQQTRPPGGMIWQLCWAIVLGDDPTNAAAIANVRAALFVGNIPTDASLSGGATLVGADNANAILTGLAVPSTTPLPDDSYVYSNEDLYAIVAGTGTVAGAANYRLIVGVKEIPQTPQALMW